MLISQNTSFEEGDVLLPSEVRNRLVEKKLLVRRGERYQFRHDLVRAYLAATYFADNWSHLFGDKVVIESNWRPMLEFAILRLSSKDIEELFNGLLRRNRQMAEDLFKWLNQSYPKLCRDWADDFRRRYADAALSTA